MGLADSLQEIDEALMSQMSPEEEDAVQAELEALQREALVSNSPLVSVSLQTRAHIASQQSRTCRIHSPLRCRMRPQRSLQSRNQSVKVSRMLRIKLRGWYGQY